MKIKANELHEANCGCFYVGGIQMCPMHSNARKTLEALESAISMLESLNMDDGGNPEMDELRDAVKRAKGEA